MPRGDFTSSAAAQIEGVVVGARADVAVVAQAELRAGLRARERAPPWCWPTARWPGAQPAAPVCSSIPFRSSPKRPIVTASAFGAGQAAPPRGWLLGTLQQIVAFILATPPWTAFETRGEKGQKNIKDP